MSVTEKATFRQRVLGREISNEDTVDDYWRWVKRFQEFFPGSDGPITASTLRDFDSWLDDEFGYAYSTRVKALSAIKLWAETMHEVTIETNADDLVRGEPTEFRPTIIDRRATEGLLEEACPAEATGCLAMRVLGYDAIMRAEEVIRARPEDIDFGAGTLWVRAAKGSHERDIGLSSRTLGLLEAQYDDIHEEMHNPRRLFYNSYGNAWTANAWSKHFLRHHHDAGFHAFGRHSAIVHRLEDGEDFGAVYIRARHKNPSMTSRYASIADRTAPDYVKEAR